MTFRPLWGTGFESGSTYGMLGIYTNYAATNAYSIAYPPYASSSYIWVPPYYGGQQYTLPVAGSDLYFKLAVYLRNGWYNLIDIGLSDGAVFRIYWNSASLVYQINGVTVGTGANAWSQPRWVRLEIHILVSDTNGIFEARLNGTHDLWYVGDTKPTAATQLTTIRWFVSGNCTMAIDDFVYGTDDWPGDFRFTKLIPTSDTTTQFGRSTGSTNYTLVDEVPPSSADYVFASISGYQDFYGITDFTDNDGTNTYEVRGINHWVYAWKETSENQGFRLVEKLNSTIASGSIIATTLYPFGTVFSNFLNTNPEGNLWTDADIDNLEIGTEVA